MNFFTELQIEYFENYLSLIKTTVENDSNKLKEKEQKIKDGGEKPFTSEDGQHWDPYDDLIDEVFHMENMEQLMYRTYMIGILVFIEDQINNVCISIERADKLMFSYKDLKGTGVGRAIKYLETVTKKDFLTDTETRKHFEIARIVRNSLVHQDGKIDKNNRKKIETYITEYPDILFLTEATYIIKIKCNYLKTLIDLSKKIYLELKVQNRPLWSNQIN